MAGLTTTFHHPCKSELPTTFKPLSIHPRTFSLRILTPKTTRYRSISTTISARYGGGGQRKSKSNEDEALDFSSVKSETVRLIDQEQKMVGIVSKAQAFQMAEDAELDLVILSPESEPPVVRIMDYNKYKYEQQKKKRDQQKKSLATRMDLKELKMGYNIDVHDYTVRLKAARRFLADGDKVAQILFPGTSKCNSESLSAESPVSFLQVKVIVSLKGRENEFRNNAIELIRRFQNDVGELAVEEAKNFRDRNIFIVLVPNKAVVQKSQEPPKKTDNSVANEVSASI